MTVQLKLHPQYHLVLLQSIDIGGRCSRGCGVGCTRFNFGQSRRVLAVSTVVPRCVAGATLVETVVVRRMLLDVFRVSISPGR